MSDTPGIACAMNFADGRGWCPPEGRPYWIHGGPAGRHPPLTDAEVVEHLGESTLTAVQAYEQRMRRKWADPAWQRQQQHNATGTW